MPSTQGFQDGISRREHFGWHSIDFGARNSLDYEYMADRFLSVPRSATMFECFRGRGDKVRYDSRTNELGVLSKDGVIRTYYMPRFCAGAPAFLVLAKKCHNEPSHLDYARKLCHQR